MTTFLMLFLSLLFVSTGLACLFAVMIGYCFVLEKNGIDPDEGWAFWGAMMVTIGGGFTIGWLFVTVCIPFIDLILRMVGLTG